MHSYRGRLSAAAVIFLLALSARLGAQAVSYGGIGEPATTPGNPASSYALSGIDHVNYYSGAVNLTIPIHSIGGRGTVADSIAIPIQRQWTVTDVSGSYVPGTGGWPIISGSYTSGFISFATVSGNPNQCVTYANGVPTGYTPLGPFLSYIVWTGTDGTETILRDLKSNGQPQNSQVTGCGQAYTPYDRGRIFQSTDGSDLTYVANSDATDDGALPPGTLITRDGRKYSFSSDSYVSKIEDSNGNEIQFSFSSTENGGIYTVTDPVNRTETINFTEDLATDTQDAISYPGSSGSIRTIKVNYGLLQNALAPGESLETYHCLFPELNGASSSTDFNGYVVSSIVLADGHSYTIQYNSYGEPARLTLPTGGVYVYKYREAACSANNGSGVVNLGNGGYAIYRRVQERDEYANGSTLSAKILFSSSAGASDPNFSDRPTMLTTVTFEDGNSNVLRTEKHYFDGNPAPTNAPAFNATEFADWWLGLEYRTDIADPTGGTLQTQQRAYGQRACPGAGESNCWYTPSSESAPLHDVQLCQIGTTLNPSGAAATAGEAYLHDPYNNTTDQYDFDFGTAPSVGASCPSSFGGALRHTHTTFLTSNATGTYTAAGTNIVGLPAETQIFGSSGSLYSDTKYGYDELGMTNDPSIVGHDNVNYAGGGMRGDRTSVSRELTSNGSWLKTSLYYDIAGNVAWVADANGHNTWLSYNDAYPDGGRSTYAHVTTLTNMLNQSESWTYDYGSGEPLSATGENGGVTSYAYSDALDRLTHTAFPNGGTLGYSYPSPAEVDAYQDQNTSGDQALRTQRLYDGLGREVELNTYESSSQYIAVTQSYDALGRVSGTTNPSRPGDGLNYATAYGYDGLGRQTSMTASDGSVAKTSYSGNQTTATDQAGHARASATDGLGRLRSVAEDPGSSPHLNYPTTYSYDAVGDLTGVNQSGRVRTFTYDSLGRLTQAANPESGTVSYTYDSVGNMLSRTDARGIKTTYVYDALSRVTSQSYSDGTPGVTNTYDAAGVANSKGQLSSVTNGNSTTSYSSFDAVGNVLASNQATAGESYPFAYAYNLAGAPTSETYPSGRVVTSYGGQSIGEGTDVHLRFAEAGDASAEPGWARRIAS